MCKSRILYISIRIKENIRIDYITKIRPIAIATQVIITISIATATATAIAATAAATAQLEVLIRISYKYLSTISFKDFKYY